MSSDVELTLNASTWPLTTTCRPMLTRTYIVWVVLAVSAPRVSVSVSLAPTRTSSCSRRSRRDSRRKCRRILRAVLTRARTWLPESVRHHRTSSEWREARLDARIRLVHKLHVCWTTKLLEMRAGVVARVRPRGPRGEGTKRATQNDQTKLPCSSVPSL